jgi:apolipoprotein N-acyltransferase
MNGVIERRKTLPQPIAAQQRTTPAAPTSPCFLPAVGSGLLLWLCYFPLAWGWLSWVALVPFLTLARAQARPRRIYWCAYAAGLAFFVPAISWMRVADYRMYATWMMLATYCALYFPVGLWLIRLLDRRSPLPFWLSVPIVWSALEWVRSFMLTGFAWYYLGHAQHRFESLIQIADLGGVYAISFLVAAVNGWIADLLFQMPGLRQRFRWIEPTVAHAGQIAMQRGPLRRGFVLESLILLTFLVGAVLYGVWRLDGIQFERGPRIALLQGNLDQRIRNQATGPGAGKKTVELMLSHYVGLGRLATTMDSKVNLVIWPETSYPYSFVAISPNLPLARLDSEKKDHYLGVLEDLRMNIAPQVQAEQLIGLVTEAYDDQAQRTKYSSALLVHRDGSVGQRFDKMHRVPFGEFVPFRDWLPFMNAFAPYDSDYSISIGKHFTRFPLGDVRFGSLICYEDTDPFLARRYLVDDNDGKPVDFLVNMSNDGWFDGSSEHDEHLIISRFRAIECRRALVRSVNMGISAIIDGNGRVLKPQTIPTPQLEPNLSPALRKMFESFHVWEVTPNRAGMMEELPPAEYAGFKKEAGVLLAYVPIDHRDSLYVRFGDWLPIGCWLLVVGLLIWTRVGRASRPALRAT